MADIFLGSSASAVSARPELSIHDGAVTTTSLQVAQFFGKRHRDVMRAIKNLVAELPESDARNFAHTCVDVRIEGAANMQGATRQDSAFRMTREGFMLLAMGFTGKEALRWKLAYIAAFNRMEAELQKPAHDPQRIQLAHRLAAQAAAQVTQTVFDAVMAADAAGWQHGRYLLSLGYDREGQATVPVAKAISHDQMVFSLPSLSEYIASGESMSSDAQLATLASACTQRLAAHAQHREKQMTLPGRQDKSSGTTSTPDTAQATLS
ncbi:Rha family transcriptional regulator [Comamonas sp. UBA7528]|uniref:Rha family transcriptional regulator n=1 Tax=Comamonas sp. UBA7528 TaxID=1946391 RepID=UPI0025BCC0C9|nr:Rha family transcriptional regulator [Comamonas sp. UBA7528]